MTLSLFLHHFLAAVWASTFRFVLTFQNRTKCGDHWLLAVAVCKHFFNVFNYFCSSFEVRGLREAHELHKLCEVRLL